MVVCAAAVLLLILWVLVAYGAIALPVDDALFAWVRRQWLAEGILLLSAIAALAILLSMRRSRAPLFCPWWKPWWVWLAWAGLTLFASIDHGLSVRAWVLWLAYGLLAFSVAGMIRTERDVLVWSVFFAATAVIVSLEAIQQYRQSFAQTLRLMEQLQATGSVQLSGWTADVFRDFMLRKRIFSVFGWPNLYAGFLLFVIPIAAGLAMYCRGALPRTLAWLVVSLLAGCLFLTLSMGAWISAILAGGTAYAWMTQAKPDKARSRYTFSKGWRIAAAIILFVVLLFIVSLVAAKRAKPYILTSSHSRLVYGEGALNVMRAFPLMGSGVGTFGLSYRSLMPLEQSEGQHSALHAHNTLLEAGAETGLVGLALMIGFLVIVGKMAARAIRREGHSRFSWLEWGIAVGVLSFFVHGLLEQTFFEAVTAPFWWIGLGLLTGAAALSGRKQNTKARDSWRLSVVLVSASSLALCLLSVHWWNADVQAATAAVVDGLGKSDDMVALFERAQRLDPINARFPLEEGRRLQTLAERSSAKERTRKLIQAREQFLRASKLSPWLAENWFHLGQVCWQLGDKVCAESSFAKAVLREPNSRVSLLHWAALLKERKEFEKLLTAARRFEKLQPQMAQGFSFEADAWSGMGKPPQAEQAFAEALKRDPSNSFIWFNYAQLLSQQGKTREAAETFRRFLASAPSGLEHEQARLVARQKLAELEGKP